MTTWNEARYCPELVAVADVRAVPQRLHLTFVKLDGFGHADASGRTLGSRSK